MNQRNFKTPVLALLLTLASASFAQSTALTSEQKDVLLAKITQRITQTAFVPGADFSKWPTIAESLKPEIAKAQDGDSFAAVVNKALNGLGYSHLGVITPQAAKVRATGGNVGIGVFIEPTAEGIKINGVIPDSPAAKAGIVQGDTIVLANGKVPKGPDGLPGGLGAVLDLRVKDSSGKVRSVSITKAEYKIPLGPKMSWHNDSVAILKIPTFDRGYEPESTRKLIETASKQAHTLILDLRNNPGGFVIRMQELAGMFAPTDKPLGTMVNRTMVNNFVRETKGQPNDLVAISAWTNNKLRPIGSGPIFKGKVAILINGGTGSAAEMISAGLRDAIGAKVIGQKSIGMVLAAIFMPLDYEFQMIVPIQDYITVSGQRLEGTGVKPDVEITDLKAEDKVYINAALEALKPKD
jgi:carboxyl-terminal processing protease